MAREFDENNAVTGSKDKPTHRIVLKTNVGGYLTISLFTHNADKSENNAFQKKLVEALGVGTDVRNFLINTIESAILEAAEKPKVELPAINFADLNKPA